MAPHALLLRRSGPRGGEARPSFGARYFYDENGNVRDARFNQTESPAANTRYRYVYTYDQRNRMTRADFRTFDGSWSNVDDYDVEGITYDKNGNLLTLKRHREGGSLVDDLTFSYTSGTNRLVSVTDAVPATPETWDAETGMSLCTQAYHLK